MRGDESCFDVPTFEGLIPASRNLQILLFEFECTKQNPCVVVDEAEHICDKDTIIKDQQEKSES